LFHVVDLRLVVGFLYPFRMKDVQGLFTAAITQFDNQGNFQPEWQSPYFAWLETLRVGVGDHISGSCNAFPELFAGLIAAFRAGQPTEPRHQRITAIHDAVKKYPSHAATKALTWLRADPPRMTVKPPLSELEPAQRKALKQVIGAMNVL
jgi:dihydrodipicolinate synthase/N-acetylneuraminate lyase